jgi:hypothetical protein
MAGRMRVQSIPISFSFLIFVVVTLHGQQSVPSISVTGSVTTPLMLTAESLAQMQRATATVSSGGIDTQYEGMLTTYVLAEAQDGYQVVFSLGEVDPALGDTPILVADKANGKALFGENGAFRIVVPRDKRGARSVRMLTKIEAVQVRK